ncbi:MAG: lysylphosphatidylglycerol synthase domain-containing protein [Gemmatimonadales bacterium]
MNGRVRVVLLLAGTALFALLVHRVGVSQIIANAAEVGWLFGPIVLLYGVAYACTTQAWRLSMPRPDVRPPFWQTYAITVSGFSLNFVTPLVNLGGEPFRASAVAPWLGRRQAVSSVVVHRMLHTLALLLAWLTALLLALVLLPRSKPIVGALLAAAAVVGGLAWLLMRYQRHGVLESGLDLLHRLPILDRLARRCEPRRDVLAGIDRHIAEAYHASRARFFTALLLEYTSRCLYVVEYWLICYGVGVPVSFAKAFLIGGLSSLALNVLFFVPFELGSKEGVLYLLFGLVGLDPQAGVYTAIVSRARDLIWIAGGLVLLAFIRNRDAVRAPVESVRMGP